MNITIRPVNADDPVIQAAIEELKGLISKRFPTAQFQVYEGDDPHGIYLETTVDLEDTDEVMDVIVDRLVDMHVEGIPVYTSTLRTPEREEAVRRQLREERQRLHPYAQ
jgi:hypothetical protein